MILIGKGSQSQRTLGEKQNFKNEIPDEKNALNEKC